MRALIITLFFYAPWSEAAELFPSSPRLERKVGFWELIFTRYESKQLVVHDKQEPRIILGTIDLPRFGSEASRQVESVDHIERQSLRFENAVDDFADRGARARSLSKLHRTIWKAYSRDKSAQRRLLLGEVELRSQGGLADTFEGAFATSEIYLPRMEKIFRQHGLPPELTRIVFVESMFNLKARSKVGASGLWQLMPGTARAYLKVDRFRDERDSPYLATQAAARILKSNYAALGSWPLAITAYNHGLGGMRRAVNEAGSTNLAHVIDRYESPSFGFASQNFYAEFLAALRTHKRLKLAQNRSQPKARRSAKVKLASKTDL